ncbi:MAG: TfoX/Sxy family protein [Clostridia bacterium]|nr:TfoX/Sxy family protein [Clostridia bacterium]
MATSKSYLDFITDILRSVGDVTFRPMMGEYLLYYRGKLVGGIYDDRLLVKPIPSVKEILGDAPLALPYEGAKEMFLVEDIEDGDRMRLLLEKLYEELPVAKRK